MASTYDVGDKIRITGTWVNSTGTTVDPTIITIYHKDPSGNTASLVYDTDVEVVRSTRGVYYADVSLDEAGEWLFLIVGTGTGEAAAEGYCHVRARQF